MKTIKILTVAFFLLAGVMAHPQRPVLPETNIYTLDGEIVRINDMVKSTDKLVIIFWKTYDKCSIDMLNALIDENHAKENVRVIGICEDGIGRIDHVKPFVYGNCIDIEVFIDKNGDLKRAMNVPDTPFSIMCDPIIKLSGQEMYSYHY